MLIVLGTHHMKLLIIRHGDPDYTNDTLTEKGWREAECLAEMLSQQDITSFYMSPLGRAQDTASLTLKKMGRDAEVLPWLREFDVRIIRPDSPDKLRIAWDWLPQVLCLHSCALIWNGACKRKSHCGGVCPD